MQEFNHQMAMPHVSGQEFREQIIQWITVQDASLLFIEAGLPRNKRSIRRYCERDDLECKKTENALHQPQYFIDEASVVAYVEQQRTLIRRLFPILVTFLQGCTVEIFISPNGDRDGTDTEPLDGFL